jgi:hypothetical protein
MATIGRRNVQEQNADAKARIRAIAASFKGDAFGFPWLIELLQAQSMPVERGVLVSIADVPEQSGQQYSGTWLTREGRFFQFDVLVPQTNAELEIEGWEDVTAQTIVSEHLPGTGKSFGFLALEVLRELQAEVRS